MAGGFNSSLSKDDILEIKREKQVLKAEAPRAVAMVREKAKECGQTRKQERSDQRYQQMLNGAGMAQLMDWGEAVGSEV